MCQVLHAFKAFWKEKFMKIRTIVAESLCIKIQQNLFVKARLFILILKWRESTVITFALKIFNHDLCYEWKSASTKHSTQNVQLIYVVTKAIHCCTKRFIWLLLKESISTEKFINSHLRTSFKTTVNWHPVTISTHLKKSLDAIAMLDVCLQRTLRST